MKLNDSVEKLPYVGKTYAHRLKRLEITTARDLLYHFPFRYRDFSQSQKIKDLVANSEVSVSGEILKISNIRTKTGKFLTKTVITDKTGAIEALWFNQPYLSRTLKKGAQVSLAGKVEPFQGKITLVSPEFEILDGEREPIHTRGLVPVYPETAKVTSKWLRTRIKSILTKNDKTFEFLPEKLLELHRFPRWKEALGEIHFPKTPRGAKKARNRFAFEELLLYNLRALTQRNAWRKRKLAVQLSEERAGKDVQRFIQDLPFELTEAQRRVTNEILADLSRKTPMNRLLEGDVGAGKTVVAAIAAYLTYLSGARTVFMAPTEVLADQHFQTLQALLKPKGVKITLRTGTKKPKVGDEFDLWLGTHALFFRKKFEKVGLVIIDEQHRFGVEQRAKLLKRARQETTPHLLTLTATPIPRTLALTVYGDLDLSVLDELPPGRKRVKTFVVPNHKREAGYNWIQKQIREGHQVFVICPLIEESEKETMQQVKAATAEYEKLQKIMPDIAIGLLHGRMLSKEKAKVMGKFRRGKVEILVSTPVVEVGIDVPNATIMIIEAADRFGLASLHQLRGRVGRGEKDSYCFLFTEEGNPKVLKRLKALEETSSGFVLAELDLKLRGPGEIYGIRQHGLTELKVADLSDTALLKEARDSAQELIDRDPNLTSHPLLAGELKRFSSALVEPN